MDIAGTVRAFLVDSFLYGQDSADLREDTSLLAAGHIDSTGVLEIIAFLESSFGVSVEPEEMVPENLDSIACIERYVLRKLSPPPPSA